MDGARCPHHRHHAPVDMTTPTYVTALSQLVRSILIIIGSVAIGVELNGCDADPNRHQLLGGTEARYVYDV